MSRRSLGLIIMFAVFTSPQGLQAQDYGAAIESKTAKIGVAPNCNEEKVSFDDFKKIGEDPSVKNINDFQSRLPKKSFQTFTLIYNSLSLQKGSGPSRVRCEWPRVLRASNDGKITFAYTCDPKSPTYGEVEVIRVDETKQLQTVSYNLKSIAKAGPHPRTTENSQSCVSCHSYSQLNGKPFLKYNWQEYFTWSDCKENRGVRVFGGFDDAMVKGVPRSRNASSGKMVGADCKAAEDRKAYNDEVECFEKFRAAQKDNPCYANLPWGTKSEDPAIANYFKSYPYAASEPSLGTLDLEVRPNLKLTNVYAMNTAARIAEGMKSNKKFQASKYYLLMEAAGCPLDAVDRGNFARLSGHKMPIPVSGSSSAYYYNENFDISKKAPLLYSFGESAGFKPGDWSMDFDQEQNSWYRAVVPMSSGQYTRGLSELVQGYLLKDEALKDPRIKSVVPEPTTKGFAEIWGKQFSCLDDLGGAVSPTVRAAQGQLCPLLKKLNAEHLDRNLANCDPVEASVLPQAPELQRELQSVAREIDAASIKRGEALSNKKCVACHSPGGSETYAQANANLFIPNTKSLSEAEKQEALARLKGRYQSGDFRTMLVRYLAEGKMPQYDSKLSEKEQEDVMNYLDAQAGGAFSGSK